jgi:hypothetical protein
MVCKTTVCKCCFQLSIQHRFYSLDAQFVSILATFVELERTLIVANAICRLDSMDGDLHGRNSL